MKTAELSRSGGVGRGEKKGAPPPEGRARRRWRRGGRRRLVAAYLFLHSPFFAVERVDILGANLVPEEEVMRLRRGIGDILLRIDPARVRRRLEDDPRIGAARVRRIPPGASCWKLKSGPR